MINFNIDLVNNLLNAQIKKNQNLLVDFNTRTPAVQVLVRHEQSDGGLPLAGRHQRRARGLEHGLHLQVEADLVPGHVLLLLLLLQSPAAGGRGATGDLCHDG